MPWKFILGRINTYFEADTRLYLHVSFYSLLMTPLDVSLIVGLGLSSSIIITIIITYATV